MLEFLPESLTAPYWKVLSPDWELIIFVYASTLESAFEPHHVIKFEQAITKAVRCA